MKLGKFGMLKQLLQSKSIKNGIWLYALQAFNSILPLLTLPYIARVLSPDEYGIFSVALNYVGYIIVVVEYGFTMTGARKIAISKNPADDSRIFTAVLMVRGILCFLCSAIVLLYSAINSFNIMSQCMLALMLMSVGTVLDQTWFFQGKQDMKYIAIINIVSRSISTALIFLCVKDSSDLIVYCLLYAIVTLINGVIGTGIICKKFGVRLQRLARSQLQDEIVEGWYLFTSSFSSKVLGSLGIIFLDWFTTPYDCGIYSALYKIPTMLLLAWNPISQVLYPITSAKMGESYETGCQFVEKLQRILLTLFVVICVILGLLAEFVVGLLLGENYVAHYYIVYPLLGWLLVAIYNNFRGVQMLLAAGYAKEYSSCIRWSALIAALGNLVGIYFWGIYGAACAPLISEVILSVLLQQKRKRILSALTQQKRVEE